MVVVLVFTSLAIQFSGASWASPDLSCAICCWMIVSHRPACDLESVWQRRQSRQQPVYRYLSLLSSTLSLFSSTRNMDTEDPTASGHPPREVAV
jgi:hypothetical protein